MKIIDSYYVPINYALDFFGVEDWQESEKDDNPLLYDRFACKQITEATKDFKAFMLENEIDPIEDALRAWLRARGRTPKASNEELATMLAKLNMSLLLLADKNDNRTRPP